jgi:hypothetical protein
MRRAQIESEFDDEAAAAAVAAALAPDNTAEIDTRVEGATVVTTVQRPTTGSLQSTVDDYVVNLDVAAQLTTTDGAPSTTSKSPGDGDDAGDTTNTNT